MKYNFWRHLESGLLFRNSGHHRCEINSIEESWHYTSWTQDCSLTWSPAINDIRFLSFSGIKLLPRPVCIREWMWEQNGSSHHFATKGELKNDRLWGSAVSRDSVGRHMLSQCPSSPWPWGRHTVLSTSSDDEPKSQSSSETCSWSETANPQFPNNTHLSSLTCVIFHLWASSCGRLAPLYPPK